MNVCVNGEAKDLAEGMTVSRLLEALKLHPKRVAVERNERIVRRADFAGAVLAPGDAIEIVTLVGGG